MSAEPEVIKSLLAAQEDREAARQASDTQAFGLIFQEIVTPLTQQISRLQINPMSDDAEIRLTLKILDNGLTKITPIVSLSRVARLLARAEELRQATGVVFSVVGSVNPDIPPTPPVASLDSHEPPPDGAPSRFVSARNTALLTVLYIDAEGREVVRQGGSRSWRNNNPGNIRMGSFADMSGAVGDDGAFAIFPDETSGFSAIVGLLRSTAYRSLSLSNAIHRYAPPAENASTRYLGFVAGETGIGHNEILGDLPIAKIRAIASAIKKMEGWTAGAERLNRPTSAAISDGGGVSAAVGAVQEWMGIAMREAALPERERSEWPDPGENPRILEYFRVAAAWFEPGDGDEVDWCAAFVNYCLVMSGHIGTDHPGARSFFWNRKNQFVRLDHPVKGAIAVRRYKSFTDPEWKIGEGHVGFVTSFTSTHVTLLGGNQSKTIQVETYPLEVRDEGDELTSKFVAFMMPVIT